MLYFQKWSGPTSLSLYVSTRNCSLASCAQYSAVVVPATPNDGPFPQPWVLHFLLFMSTISSGACCAQYSAVFVPASPNDGAFTQPWVLHFLLLTLTFPSGVCCAQYSLFLYLQLRTTVPCRGFWSCTLCCRRRPFRTVRAVHSTPPFLYLPLQTTTPFRKLGFCILCS